MAKKNYYAVAAGKRPGIYQTWSETQEQINGFSGAKFKGFATLHEAEKYLTQHDSQNPNENLNDVEEDIEQINNSIELMINNLKDKEVIAFVDGAYSPDADGKEKYGFGAILITKEGEHQLHKAFVKSDYMTSRNIAGEIEGVKEAINWATKNKMKQIRIFYDYEGIEKWAAGEWKANKPISRDYVEFLKNQSTKIKVDFQHSKAHSGILYNEKADELAKFSLLAKGYKTYDDGSIYFTGYSVKDWLKIVDIINEENNSLGIVEEIKVYNNELKDYLTKIDLFYKNDKLVINCYKGKKSYVQGKQSVLFQKVVSFAVEMLVNSDEVIEKLSNYYALTIEEEDVIVKFNQLLPNFPHEFNDQKHYNTLLSAVYNTMLVGYMPDYTCLITPVFRATEYYLHRILHDKLGKETAHKNGANKFNYFSKDDTTNEHYYNSIKEHLNDDQEKCLNDLYNYYQKIRHPYTHWSQNSIDSQVITDIIIAREHLENGLHLVNNYYIIF